MKVKRKVEEERRREKQKVSLWARSFQAEQQVMGKGTQHLQPEFICKTKTENKNKRKKEHAGMR